MQNLSNATATPLETTCVGLANSIKFAKSASSADVVAHKVKQLDYATMRQRHFWFMGSSVTGQYAIVLRSILQRASGSPTDSLFEFSSEDGCLSPEGRASSCTFDAMPHASDSSTRTNITFLWKTCIGLGACNDDPRDFCRQSPSTEACFRQAFRHATSDSVLVIGAVPTNSTELAFDHTTRDDGHHSRPRVNFEQQGLSWLRAARHAAPEQLSEMLLRTFPGRIIWHSFPHLHETTPSMQGTLPSSEVSHCFRALDAISRKIARSSTRMSFADIANLQERSARAHADIFHHPGKLPLSSAPITEQIVNLIVAEATVSPLLAHLALQREYRYPESAIVYHCSSTPLKQWGRAARTPRGGLSDLTTGAVSTFLLALLRGLPFFIDCSVLLAVYRVASDWLWRGPPTLTSSSFVRVDGNGAGVREGDFRNSSLYLAQNDRGQIHVTPDDRLLAFGLT